MVLTGYGRRVEGALVPAQMIDPATVAGGDPAEIAAACLARVDPGLAERAREGDVLVVDGAVLAGPGAEEAVIALQALGLAALLCVSGGEELAAMGAIYGLPVLSTEAAGLIAEGELLRIDLARGTIEAGLQRWQVAPLGEQALAAVRRAQLLARMRRVVEDEGYGDG